jgi:hypothetical protein
MDKDEFMKWLKYYTVKYLDLCKYIELPVCVMQLTAYNVGRLYFNRFNSHNFRVFDGNNMNWDFIFACSLWVSTKVLMDEDYNLDDLCYYVSHEYTVSIFVDMEYIFINLFGFDLGYKFIRELYEKDCNEEIITTHQRQRVVSKGSRGSRIFPIGKDSHCNIG